ncbi:hypothetical protein QYF36_025923 [Acer negundo]|nr:hypothetical protein QYF36_025923 [Acer negundo]
MIHFDQIFLLWDPTVEGSLPLPSQICGKLALLTVYLEPYGEFCIEVHVLFQMGLAKSQRVVVYPFNWKYAVISTKRNYKIGGDETEVEGIRAMVVLEKSL